MKVEDIYSIPSRRRMFKAVVFLSTLSLSVLCSLFILVHIFGAALMQPSWKAHFFAIYTVAMAAISFIPYLYGALPFLRRTMFDSKNFAWMVYSGPCMVLLSLAIVFPLDFVIGLF